MLGKSVDQPFDEKSISKFYLYLDIGSKLDVLLVAGGAASAGYRY